MFSNISWGSYWTALTILVILYYACVLLLFYMHEIRQLLSGKRKLMPAAIAVETEYNGSENEPEDDDLPVEVQTLTREVTAYLDQAKYAGSIKDEILFGTQQILKKYPSMKNSIYHEGINKLLQFETKSRCAVHLSHEELRQVWLS